MLTPSTRRTLLASAAGLLAGLVYLNALHNPFVYDDYHTVVANTSIQRGAGLRAIVLHDVIRPLTNVSYAIDRALWGAGPLGFHVTSVLLHMLNVVLLFQLAWRLAHDRQARGDTARTSPVSPELVAGVSAALFAVHPMMTEAVGYISGRSEVLCATWFLLALLCGRRWVRGDDLTLTAELTEATESRRLAERSSAPSVVIPKWAAATIGLWVMALATKETAAMFPFVLAAYDWLAGPGSAMEKRRRMFRVHLPLVAVTLVAGLARLVVFARVEYAGQVRIHPLYILLELDVIRRYLALLLNPSGQALFHEVSAIGSVIDPRALVAVAAVGGMVALAWLVRRVDWLASFGVFWFLLLLVPSTALIVLDQGEPMTEHRVYLASCGIFLAAAAGIDWLRAWLARASPRSGRLAAGALALVLVAFSTETLLRNAVWASPVTLWRESVDLAPRHFRPRLLLGEALEDAGRREEAIEEFKAAISLRPTEATGYVKLGRCLADVGRLNEATAAFKQLQDLDPRSVAASSGLAVVAMMSGQPDRARQHFLETIAIDPRNVSARQSLAVLEETALANPAEALRLCEEIERLAPGTPGNDDCIRRNRARPPF